MIFETKNILFICPLWGQFLMKCFNNACFPSLSHPQPDALMLCTLASFLRIACRVPELSHLPPPLPMDVWPSSPSRASHHDCNITHSKMTATTTPRSAQP